MCIYTYQGDTVVKNPPASVRDKDSIPGLGGSLGVPNGNTMDRGAWRASPWGQKESDMTKKSTHASLF